MTAKPTFQTAFSRLFSLPFFIFQIAKSMKNVYFFLLFSLFLNQKMAAQWHSFTPALDDTVGFADTKMLDANRLMAVGLRYGVNDTFYSFGVTTEVHFVRSLDGGATTETHKVPVVGAPFIANMAATDENTAYIIGLSDFANAFTLKTIDGGATWANANTPWDAVKSWPDYIHAFTAAKLCVIGDPRDGEFEIYNSVNGGQFWQPVPLANIPDPLAGEFGFNNIGDAAGNTIWFGTSAGRVFRSKNAGLNWEAFQTPLVSTGLMSFSDENHGIIASNNSLTETDLFSTADGGQTWADITPADKTFRLTGIECIPNSPFVIMNRSTGSILKSANFSTWISADRGATWQQIGSGDNVGWIKFLNPSDGFGGEFMQMEHKSRLFNYSGSPLVGLFSMQKLEAEVRAFPNPTADFFTLELKSEAEAQDFLLLVNDAAGRLVVEKTFSKTAFLNEKIELAGLAAGLYRVTVSAATGSFSTTVLKK